MKESKIIEWLKNEKCRIPDGLETFLDDWKEPEGESVTTPLDF